MATVNAGTLLSKYGIGAETEGLQGMMLDVGCGYEPHGDVNVDLFTRKCIHRNEDLNPRKILNFVLADLHHLPFRSETFHIVYSKHVLEHKGVRLMEAIKEMLRVCSQHLILVVPNLFRYSKHESYHDKIFQPSDFHKLFKHYDHKVTAQGYDWTKLYVPKGNRILRGRHSIFKHLPGLIPTELKCEVWK